MGSFKPQKENSVQASHGFFIAALLHAALTSRVFFPEVYRTEGIFNVLTKKKMSVWKCIYSAKRS